MSVALPRRPVHESRTSGFTLVEVLVAITIIGILAGILIPAITGAVRTAKEAAIRMEVGNIDQALEAYKLQYGDYPPDFYDWDQVERHFRKAFPEIDSRELALLAQFTHVRDNSGVLERMGASVSPADPRSNAAFDHHPHMIDRAEALVFCLSGFSNDKNRPFTGAGGPLVLRSGSSLATALASDEYLLYQFNSELGDGLFEFDPTQLTIGLDTTGATPATLSTDEAASHPLGYPQLVDPFPVYLPGEAELPVAYFNSRNYDDAFGQPAGGRPVWSTSSAPRDDHFLNQYMPGSTSASDTGVARPYASSQVDTTPPTSTFNGFTVPAGATFLEFVEASRFQLISSGLDDNYGGLIAPGGFGAGAGGIGVYASGEFYNPLNTTLGGTFATLTPQGKYQDDLVAGGTFYSAQPQLDNITNFSTRTLESDLP